MLFSKYIIGGKCRGNLVRELHWANKLYIVVQDSNACIRWFTVDILTEKEIS